MDLLKELQSSMPNLHSATVSEKEFFQNTIHEDPKKIGGVGASEVGKLFTQKGLSAKTAHTFAYEKAKEIINGYREFVSTNAMLHGINSEIDAYNDVIKVKYPHAVLKSDVSMFISDEEGFRYWATPDVVDDYEGMTMDAKCPYTPYTFWNNVNSITKNKKHSYRAQNQMQMIATGHKKGAICLYLTGSEVDENGNKKEYNIPCKDRSFFIYQDADKEFQKEITVRIDEFFPMRDLILKGLKEAPEVSDEELFKLCRTCVVKKFKENSNLLIHNDDIIFCNGEYYTYKVK